MENKLIHSITAYSCKVCTRYKKIDLLSADGDEHIDIISLLNEYAVYISKCIIDKGTSRAIKLSESIETADINENVKRIIIKPDAGKALENFSVINTKTNRVSKFSGDENSAIYPHYVFCYTNGEKSIFIFHHFGQSGCKTVFENTFNKFLATKNLISHFDIILSNEMFEDEKTYVPQKLRLLTTYTEKKSSDKADNDEILKKTEQEVIISLDAPKAHGVKELLKQYRTKEPNIEELKKVLIKSDYVSDFEEAKLTVKFGNASRLISLSEFSGLIGDYDITDKVEIMADHTIRESSFFPVVDKYALALIKQE